MKQKFTYVSPMNEEIEWNDNVILCASTGATVDPLIEDDTFVW